MDLKLQWIYCSVYPLAINAIKKKIDSIFDEYTYLMKVSNDKKERHILELILCIYQQSDFHLRYYC